MTKSVLSIIICTVLFALSGCGLKCQEGMSPRYGQGLYKPICDCEGRMAAHGGKALQNGQCRICPSGKKWVKGILGREHKCLPWCFSNRYNGEKYRDGRCYCHQRSEAVASYILCDFRR
ncbi:MAG: hypothetical protein ABII72_01760 [Parcubacteria group bacterium]